MKDWDFPCNVMFSDSGWERFGQKERYKGRNRIGIALGVSRSKSYLAGYIRVKWDNCKTIQYYLPISLKKIKPSQEPEVKFH